jgi:RNA polymerase sigma-70 factor (ECF subfamily)
MSWTEVEELVRLAQSGDRVAFGDLVTRFQGAVVAAALTKLRDAGEAQELAQEVFVHAMRKLPQLREPRCFAGWLRRITARMAINRLTRRGPIRGADAGLLEAVPAMTVGPLDDLLRAEQRTAVQAGLRRLKPLDRQALEAFYLRGRSLKRIARELALPVGTVKRRLHVARRRLKAVLEGPAPARRRRRELTCV